MKIINFISMSLLTSAAAMLSASALAATNTAATTTTTGATNTSFTPAQTRQIEQIIRNYLVTNPQVLVEASKALEKQNMDQMQQTAGKGISENAKDLFNNPDSPVMGNAQGNVTLVEFMDYQCGHCKEMGPVIEQLIKTQPQLRVVIKEFPIFGETSEFAAKAALASMKQGKFAVFHAALLSDKNPLTQDEVIRIAQSVGLDTTKLKQDMNDVTVTNQLKDNVRLSQELGLIGTPALVIGNKNGNKTAFIPGTANKASLEDIINKVQG